ncbi:ferritin family protein [Chloroflexota bacterium]
MATEQDKTQEGIQTAIQMEIDGKKFYLKASQESSHEMGKELLKSLAAEEDIHRKKFEKIYEEIRNKKDWPKVDFQPDGGKRLRTILVKAIESIATDIKAAVTELHVVQTAIDMESKTYDFYKTQGKNTAYGATQDFFEALAAEEREHHLVLLDYYEYLKDPAAWFVNKEHPSLDGV